MLGKNYILLILLLSFVSCNDNARKNVQYGFYYWKTQELSASNAKVLETSHTSYLYRKILDVDWNDKLNEAIPITKVDKLDAELLAQEQLTIIPVAFITNKAMLALDTLAAINLANKLGAFFQQWQALQQKKFTEFQVDCDWTPKSKDNYFVFLRALKKVLGTAELSVTLRLYPYKYPNLMGVPPVDKAVLMCYNMGSIKDRNTTNSIIDPKTMESYMTTQDYPLHLDVALPIYGWHVWFRQNEYQGILYDTTWNVIKPNTKLIKDNWSVLNDEVSVGAKFFRPGDVFRNEYPPKTDYKQYFSLIKKYVPNAQRILFFHLDDNNINKYEDIILQ